MTSFIDRKLAEMSKQLKITLIVVLSFVLAHYLTVAIMTASREKRAVLLDVGDSFVLNESWKNFALCLCFDGTAVPVESSVQQLSLSESGVSLDTNQFHNYWVKMRPLESHTDTFAIFSQWPSTDSGFGFEPGKTYRVEGLPDGCLLGLNVGVKRFWPLPASSPISVVRSGSY